jgi:hypothetical protein
LAPAQPNRTPQWDIGENHENNALYFVPLNQEKGNYMAIHNLSRHFGRFFDRLNPASTFERQASSQYGSIKGLLEAVPDLTPTCFLQGSYRQDTAIYTINDVDVIALCQLVFPGT